MLCEAAHLAYPLRGGRAGDLPLQHRHGIRKRAHAVPAELHIEAETAADDVKMVVVQSWQDVASLEIDDSRCRAGKRQDIRVPAHTHERKSTRLNSSHSQISYAVFCLKKKKEE